MSQTQKHIRKQAQKRVTIYASILVLLATLLISLEARGTAKANTTTKPESTLNPEVNPDGNVHQNRSASTRVRITKKRIPHLKFLIRIGQCEQPAHKSHYKNKKWDKGYAHGIDWKHESDTYPGGLGVFAALWLEEATSGLAYARVANRATPHQQLLQAEKIITRYGKHAWGCAGVAGA
jgi:hypothetical protein